MILPWRTAPLYYENQIPTTSSYTSLLLILLTSNIWFPHRESNPGRLGENLEKEQLVITVNDKESYESQTDALL